MRPRTSDDVGDGRKLVAVIGIDCYQSWPALNNAVNDARGVLAVFESLGFKRAMEPLLNQAATAEALRRLSDELRVIAQDSDSLVVFFAGHGHTENNKYESKGFLIPVDAEARGNGRSKWLGIDEWLDGIAGLPLQHALVFLDSCYSGRALGHDIRWRGHIPSPSPQITDHVRLSRRVITSTRGDERARDDGPISGHSLFTGCLIRALQGGIFKLTRKRSTTDWFLSEYLQDQVCAYGPHQTPEMGTLAGHDNGALRIPLVKPKRPSLATVDRQRHTTPPVLPTRTEGWTLEAAFVAFLDRQHAERARGARVLSIVPGPAMAAQTAWGTWAAGRGYLAMVTEARDLDAAIADLLAQTPWLRCVPAARKRLAAAAKIEVDAVDAALDARSAAERRRWIDDVAGIDRHVQVSGWLLSALRQSKASVPDFATAPVKGGDLLAIACDLASPTAVLFCHPAADAAWLERAIATAAALLGYMPGHSIAVTAPEDLVTRVLHGERQSAALSMARQGLVAMAMPAQRSPGRTRRTTTRALFDALARDPRTRGRFELDGQVALPGEPEFDVDLVAPAARFAVELDGWYHFLDPDGYRRDRARDLRLQRAGYFVIRFLAEDVDEPQRLARLIDDIAIALASRRATGVLF